jgi:Protein of unknown function (DUF3455)
MQTLRLAGFVVLATWCSAPWLVGCTADVDGAEPISAEAETEALLRCEPRVPDELAAPKGHRLAFSLTATGDQIYVCQAGPAGQPPAWTLKAPDADLFRFGRLFGTHYAGPTWEARDGSTVVAARLASASVDAAAIPWLLLEATQHTGDGFMSEVTYIQRLDTVGGLAKASGCDADHVGETSSIEYSARYAFFEAKKRNSR